MEVKIKPDFTYTSFVFSLLFFAVISLKLVVGMICTIIILFFGSNINV